jgi:hypothetical protein
MNAALEFHDSHVETIQADADRSVSLHFSGAYIHTSVGQPGIDLGTGHSQQARLSFSEARFAGDLAQCVGALSNGALMANGHSMSLLPVPYSFRGPVTAEFTFQNGVSIRIDASAVECTVFGPTEFVEAFDP